MDGAVAYTAERKRQVVFDATLLLVLARHPEGPVLPLVERFGGDTGALLAELERGTAPRRMSG